MRTPWGPAEVRRLREALGFSQRQMAVELGVRQQTISEWETGAYRPRGASARVLTLLAERRQLLYDPDQTEPSTSGEQRR